MLFGLQLTAPLPLAAYPCLAARAEAYGFVDLTVHDLLLRRPVWPLLATLAGATRRIAVGPDVTHPVLHHPATIAANIAHPDEVSGGRAVPGVGRGSVYGWGGLGPLPGPSLVGGASAAGAPPPARRGGGV